MPVSDGRHAEAHDIQTDTCLRVVLKIQCMGTNAMVIKAESVVTRRGVGRQA